MKAALKTGLLAAAIHSIAAFICFLIVAADSTQAADSEFGMPAWTWLMWLDSPVLLPAVSYVRATLPTFHPSNAKALAFVLLLGGLQWCLIGSVVSLVTRRLFSPRRLSNANVA